MSVLAIDIGNTRIGFGVFTDAKSMEPAQRITHAEIESRLPELLQTAWEQVRQESHDAQQSDMGIVIASVVPDLTITVANLVRETLGLVPLIIGRDLKIPVKTALASESTIGVDRLLGALSAYVHTEKACAIVSVGSALVIDCVDDDGVFRGGAIAPGLAMGARALHDYSAQLPEVELLTLGDEVPYGRNTAEAINLGLFAAARGAVRELLERYASDLGTWPHVVATGGDAIRLLGESGLVDSAIPDLVLQGAALVWEFHGQNIESDRENPE